ncbi:MAG: prohibitin family protein [Gammaproteobacteria bacterium]|nr:prohibitin family protein [Gammaproteobacteria bacterium]
MSKFIHDAVRSNRWIPLALIAIVLGWSAFVTVGPGERGVLMTFGKVEPGVLAPGLHFKLPLMQSVKMIDVRIQKSEEQQTAATKDLQDVTTTAAVNWSIDAGDAEWVYQHIGDERALVTKLIEPIVSNAVKAVAAGYDAEDLVEHRNEIRGLIEKQVVASLTPYKVQVEGVNITNFRFSSEYSRAIEAKQVAQQRAQQAEYDLQRAQVNARQKIAEARGQAEAQKLLQQTLTPAIIEFNAVQKWNGVLPQVLGGQGVMPFIGALQPGAK